MKKLALKKSVLLASALFGCLSISQIASAADKTVTCQIDESGRTLYKGKCTFTPQGNGSFYLSGKALSKKVEVAGIMVWIEQPNVAVVQGTKFSGGASTWGNAVKSSKQKACWVGEGNSFKVCAW
ncbi:hypothetical protein [Acinetobacter brisouii]|uniref:hypothetical protein n=1 Tax=Acinetobacter brisouii TaxID=396323 RepID=UPI0035AF3BD7